MYTLPGNVQAMIIVMAIIISVQVSSRIESFHYTDILRIGIHTYLSTSAIHCVFTYTCDSKCWNTFRNELNGW